MNSAVTVPDYGWKEQAEESHTYLDAPILALLDAFKAGRNSLRVFDAGCGNGVLAKLMADRGHVVAGCDASESGIAQARRICGDRVRIERMSVCDALVDTFGDDWDVVVATEVVEHLYAPRDFIREAQLLLAPGGMLVLSTPYHGYFKNLALAATGKLDAHFTALWDGGHIKFWSYQTLTRLLAEFGFVDFRFIGAGRVPGLWKSMIVSARKPH